MEHRHLNHERYTLAAIDDVIARGGRKDWAGLLSFLRRENDAKNKVLKVCQSHITDPYAQRYHFWMNYVKDRLA